MAGQVAELWRYPVKSLGGQKLAQAPCVGRGIEGDRRWAVRGTDGKLGSGKTTRRFRRMPGLLSMSSSVDDDDQVWVHFPSGDTGRVDDPATSAAVGAVVDEEVGLVEEASVSHFDDAPLHLLSSASLAWLHALRPGDQIDRRRFRPNLVIDVPWEPGRVEQEWIGHELQIGEVTVSVAKPTERCVMITLAQDGLPFAPHILSNSTMCPTRSSGCTPASSPQAPFAWETRSGSRGSVAQGRRLG